MSGTIDNNQSKAAFDVWKEAQSSQRHFNDILFKIRNFAFIFAGATVGVVGSLISQDSNLAGWLLIFACVPWLSLYFIDRFYYHLLLKAAVYVSREIEKEFMQGIPQLSTKITEINRRQPLQIPFIMPKTGREKVTTFYALPLITALSLGSYLIYKNPLLCFFVFILTIGLMISFEKC
jgi:hypothetical protein